MIKLIKICLLSFFVISCNGRSNNAAGLISDMVGREVKFNFEDPLADTLIVGKEYKLVCYLDAHFCSSCNLGDFTELETVVSRVNKLKNNINFVFICNPAKEDKATIKLSIWRQKLKNEVIIDTTGQFLKNNLWLPNKRGLNTFLVDKDDKIVLVGSPVNNKKLMKLYQDIFE